MAEPEPARQPSTHEVVYSQGSCRCASQGDAELVTHCWTPQLPADGSLRGLVVLFHGYGAHGR